MLSPFRLSVFFRRFSLSPRTAVIGHPTNAYACAGKRESASANFPIPRSVPCVPDRRLCSCDWGRKATFVCEYFRRAPRLRRCGTFAARRLLLRRGQLLFPNKPPPGAVCHSAQGDNSWSSDTLVRACVQMSVCLRVQLTTLTLTHFLRLFL